VRIGEETGALEKSLLRIADDYEKQAGESLKVMVQLLEPSVILVMGLVVGFIVLSMLLPIFQLNVVVK
jgi:general secretion pathway protein F